MNLPAPSLFFLKKYEYILFSKTKLVVGTGNTFPFIVIYKNIIFSDYMRCKNKNKINYNSPNNNCGVGKELYAP